MDRVAASKEVGKLSQPTSMYSTSWKKLQKVLRVLCHHLPDPYPGIRRVSAQTRIPMRTVARLLTQAEALGLVARVNRPLPGRFDGYAYRLTFLDSVPDTVPVSAQTGTEEEQLRCSMRTSSSSPIKAGGTLPPPAGRRHVNRGFRKNMYDGNCALCDHLVTAWTGQLVDHRPVHLECDTMKERYGDPNAWGPTLGEDPEAPLPVYHPPPQKPQARLAKHFEDRWNTEALRKYPDWRGMYRGIDLGPAIGYINQKFLTAGYSEEHVRAMINEFFDDLLWPESDLNPKEGKSVWQLFTSWWGHNPVPDPKIERERERFRGRILHEARKLRVKQQKTEKAAWERINAAEAAGVELDPDDLVTIGVPDPRLCVGRRKFG